MGNQSKQLDLTGLDDYYQREFKKIHESNGNYKGKWNWWAFFFTGIWCLIKGCWVFAILIFLTYSSFKYKLEIKNNTLLSLGFGNLVLALISGWLGTWNLL